MAFHRCRLRIGWFLYCGGSPLSLCEKALSGQPSTPLFCASDSKWSARLNQRKFCLCHHFISTHRTAIKAARFVQEKAHLCVWFWSTGQTTLSFRLSYLIFFALLVGSLEILLCMIHLTGSKTCARKWFSPRRKTQIIEARLLCQLLLHKFHSPSCKHLMIFTELYTLLRLWSNSIFSQP